MPATARNTPNPIFAVGIDDAPVAPIAPASNQGLAVSLCCANHHATIAGDHSQE